MHKEGKTKLRFVNLSGQILMTMNTPKVDFKKKTGRNSLENHSLTWKIVAMNISFTMIRPLAAKAPCAPQQPYRPGVSKGKRQTTCVAC